MISSPPGRWPAPAPDGRRPEGVSPGAAVRRRRRAPGSGQGQRLRRIAAQGGTITPESAPESLHDLRKRAKELRYLLELFGPLWPEAEIKPRVAALKKLQDTLGRFQDREVQAAMLRSLREEVAAVEDGAAALMAMGLLVERLEQEQSAARAEFAERFAAFAARPQQTLVRTAFA